MLILNPGSEDYHMHSSTFSDGWNSVDEMVRYAGELGLTKIAITDHSQVGLERNGIGMKTFRNILHLWKNVHNDVEVVFGVEADLLDNKGNVCYDIQGVPGDFVILSAHPDVYSGRPEEITHAYIQAIQKHHKNIGCIGHPDARYFSAFLDMEELVKVANHYGIPLELNGSCLSRGFSDLAKLETMLERADRIYVNSDAHTLNQLRDARKFAFDYLRQKGIAIP
jgi:DNA polymerase (family 10)